ncbi:hypothetical protein MBANPS3_001118 [Mucor bainieri]
MQKGRATRRILLKKYYQYLVAAEAKSTATLSTIKKPKMVSFIGNWHRNSRHLRGHTTRSLKPYLPTLSTTSSVRLVDEYNSTKMCCSCFQETQKQLVRDTNTGRMRRNLGAVTCYNIKCPRRLAKKTTMNTRCCPLFADLINLIILSTPDWRYEDARAYSTLVGVTQLKIGVIQLWHALFKSDMR